MGDPVKQDYSPGEFRAHKVGKELFDVYKDEVNKQMDRFGMHNIYYSFQHAKVKEMRASCTYTADYRANFMLSTIWMACEPPTIEEIRGVARHEVAHALTGRINILATTKGVTDEAVADENESFAHRMEKYITWVEGTIEKLESKIRSYEYGEKVGEHGGTVRV